MILTTVIFSIVGEVKRSARRVEKINQMKQIGLALDLYKGDNHGLYPVEGYKQGESWTDLANVYARSDAIFTNKDFEARSSAPPVPHTRGFSLNACHSTFRYESPLGDTVAVFEAARLIAVDRPNREYSTSRLPCPDKLYAEFSATQGSQAWMAADRYLADYDRKGSLYLWSDGHVEWMSLDEVSKGSDCTCWSTQENRFYGVMEKR